MFKKRCKSKSGYFDIEIGLKDFKPGVHGLQRMPKTHEAMEGVETFGISKKKKYIDVFNVYFKGKKIAFSEASKKVIFVDEIQDRGHPINPTSRGNFLVIASDVSDGLLIQLSWDTGDYYELLTWAVTAQQGVVLFCKEGPP